MLRFPVIPIPHPKINALLQLLLAEIQNVLGSKLVGLYLYGSLVWGDFDYEISDIDLLAAVATDVDEQEFDGLKQMHNAFTRNHPEWRDRIEVQYFSCYGLKTFKSQSSPMVNISPGEPIHFIKAGAEWLMNWYFVREYGVTLFGPPPATLIEPISEDEFLQAVKDHARVWREHIVQTMHSRPYQSYAILTMCRALYTSRTGQQVSKRKAALWAQQQLPEWRSLIQKAIEWRADSRNQQIVHEATYPETAAFVHAMIERIEANST
jgi:predicted nucleotidyltransferase